jgi:chorismate mutase-like protein
VEISDWRNKIDQLEREILKLMNERAGYALEIGKINQQEGWPIYHPAREKDIWAKIVEQNQGPLPKESITRIFTAIIEENRKLQSSHFGNPEQQ